MHAVLFPTFCNWQEREAFNEDAQHSSHAVIIVVVKVCILEDLMSLQSIVCVHSKNDVFTLEYPWLEIE